MASASVHRTVNTNKPTRATSEQARIDVALKQAAAHARKQLAAQGIPNPCWTFAGGTVLMLRHEHWKCFAAKARLPAVFAQLRRRQPPQSPTGRLGMLAP